MRELDTVERQANNRTTGPQNGEHSKIEHKADLLIKRIKARKSREDIPPAEAVSQGKQTIRKLSKQWKRLPDCRRRLKP